MKKPSKGAKSSQRNGKVVSISKETIIDKITGEVLSDKETTVTRRDKGKEPDFIKIYLDTVLYWRNLPKGYSPILMAFLKRMSYAEKGQYIVTGSVIKNDIAEELGVTPQYIEKAITNLVKGKIFIKKGRGFYTVNPQFFGKGDWKDIEEIRSTVTFNGKGTSFITEIEKKSSKKNNQTEDPDQLKMNLVEGL